MNLGSRGPVVVDTGVFGARLTPSGHDRIFANVDNLELLTKLRE
jgi:hypothetical protein